MIPQSYIQSAVRKAKNEFRGKSSLSIAYKMITDSVKKSLTEKAQAERDARNHENQITINAHESRMHMKQRIRRHQLTFDGEEEIYQPLDNLQHDLKLYNQKSSTFFYDKRYRNWDVLSWVDVLAIQNRPNITFA